MMKIGRRVLSSIALLAFVSSISVGCAKTNTSAKAEMDYPKKPIEMTVGFAAGGMADIVTRLSVEAAGKHLPNKQSIVVSNKLGASGSVQLAEVFQQKPDGYKLGSVTTGNLIIQPNFGNTPYKSNDFEPVALLNTAPNVLVVKSDAPWKTYKEWLEYVKKNPSKFTYGTAGTGDTKHVAMETLNVTKNIKTKHVGFEGSAQSITALMGGHIMGAVVGLQEAMPLTQSGKIRVLANLGSSKADAYKDAPFLKETEQGFPGFDTFTGILAPKNTPKEVIKILDEAFKKGLKDPKLIEELKKIGTEPTYAGPEEFKKIIKTSAKTSEEIMKKAGLTK
ncbi:Bug family tripartite tricarboxylate transporter substrate binding protein [Neobacillus terrae]|uniref:Bug family tripartite tricarboxylate transporter substrate binding protein n=1 Tax=Neobacillus terrae TaxID=3034837 RepID=UPI0014096D48|nr:tripartite tricarboxylate transporter substrate binding protein [Neobacillus terrae]NHM31365.1 tripartite tricarboxylate transporter substrate binding protein [Neobacillus terrae]